MKNKVLATLLAVCLFVGLAIPAFASATSSQSGDPSDVKSVTFDKDSYTINKDSDEDFKDKVTAFVDDTKMVLDAGLTFELTDNNAGVFAIDGSVVSAVEKSGSATLVVKNIDDKVVGKVKISATAAKAATKDATGFRYEKKEYNVPVMSDANKAAAATKAGDFEFKIIPTPVNSAFAPGDVTNIMADVEADLVAALANGNNDFTAADIKHTVNGDNELVVTIAGADLKANMVDKDWATAHKNVETSATINGKTITSRASFKTVAGKVAIGVSAPSEITIEVGELYKLGDKVKHVASDANIKGSITYTEEYLNDDAENYDYAIVNGDGEVKGIAVGKNKIISETSYTSAADANGVTHKVVKTATTIVNVVKRGTKTPDAGSVALANSVANTKVGGTFKMVVKNAPADAKITYSSFDEKVAKVAADGTVTAIGAGTTKVVADVNGTKLYCTVTVAAAPATSTPSKPTEVPKTVDALLVNLF